MIYRCGKREARKRDKIGTIPHDREGERSKKQCVLWWLTA